MGAERAECDRPPVSKPCGPGLTFAAGQNLCAEVVDSGALKLTWNRLENAP